MLVTVIQCPQSLDQNKLSFYKISQFRLLLVAVAQGTNFQLYHTFLITSENLVKQLCTLSKRKREPKCRVSLQNKILQLRLLLCTKVSLG